MPLDLPVPAQAPAAQSDLVQPGTAGGSATVERSTVEPKAAAIPSPDAIAPIFRVRPPVYRIVSIDSSSAPGTTLELVDLPMFPPSELQSMLQALVASRSWAYDAANVHLEYETKEYGSGASTASYLVPVYVFSGPDGKVTQDVIADTPSLP
jgi:hypothetical protein